MEHIVLLFLLSDSYSETVKIETATLICRRYQKIVVPRGEIPLQQPPQNLKVVSA